MYNRFVSSLLKLDGAPLLSYLNLDFLQESWLSKACHDIKKLKDNFHDFSLKKFQMLTPWAMLSSVSMTSTPLSFKAKSAWKELPASSVVLPLMLAWAAPLLLSKSKKTENNPIQIQLTIPFIYRLASGFVPSKYKTYYKQFTNGKDCAKIKCGTFA